MINECRSTSSVETVNIRVMPFQTDMEEECCREATMIRFVSLTTVRNRGDSNFLSETRLIFMRALEIRFLYSDYNVSHLERLGRPLADRTFSKGCSP